MSKIPSTNLTLLSLLAILSSACLSPAQDSLPIEAGEIQIKYAEKIARADRDYLKALEKLKTKFIKLDDMETANQVAGLIEYTKAERSGLDDLCQIKVTSNTTASAPSLKKGVPRLSGGYRPSFSFVSKRIEGSQFIRVPWKSKPTFKIEVEHSGYLYMTGVSWKTFDEADLPVTRLNDRIEGSYLGQVFAVYVTAGQSFECGGYESCLIAKSIIIR